MPSYKFRVLIDTVNGEEIFRDIAMPGKDNFESFYNTIIKAFGFRGDQMGSFYVSNESWDRGHEITLLDMRMNEDQEGLSIMKDTPLSTFVEEKGQRLVLVYDFLKMWCFMIECVDIRKETVKSPKVELVAGEAPAEDSKEADPAADPNFGASAELGEDFDDIFSDFDEDDPLDGGEAFDNPEGIDEY